MILEQSKLEQAIFLYLMNQKGLTPAYEQEVAAYTGWQTKLDSTRTVVQGFITQKDHNKIHYGLEQIIKHAQQELKYMLEERDVDHPERGFYNTVGSTGVESAFQTYSEARAEFKSRQNERDTLLQYFKFKHSEEIEIQQQAKLLAQTYMEHPLGILPQDIITITHSDCDPIHGDPIHGVYMGCRYKGDSMMHFLICPPVKKGYAANPLSFPVVMEFASLESHQKENKAWITLTPVLESLQGGPLHT